ncbi:hypothetical protein J437_LFUL007097 [Ladona fulva]|uniref:RecQ-mediated genome instability protein 1 n=1 Tax=Ladona fulva TaxID=123851 RepID=A0A8K0K3C1_LADFU|nr:hypothetical protein J437_LFUL007097 [Ladona fulva]
MEMGSLPPNLCSLKDITLSGTYAVQVECVRDISVPAYSQLLLVRGVSTENTEATKKQAETWEPKPGRVLRLTLFDGVQETMGMEYSPIREIDKGLTPGTKVIFNHTFAVLSAN